MIDWNAVETQLKTYWKALGRSPGLLSEWQASCRFPELTYVREDLIGSYKARKYASLVPWLIEQGYQTVHLEGSSHSSNILRLSLLLRQHGIHPSYVLEGREGPPVGNGLLSRLVLGEDFLTECPTKQADWSVPEGASCKQALAGSLGIVASLVQQALSRKAWPQDIFIDSGTGFTAAALILGLGYFELPCQVHVVSMTGRSQEELAQILDGLKAEATRLLGQRSYHQNYGILYPSVGQSFGSTPARVFEEIETLAQKESLLVDPLYTAKLSLSYEERRDPERAALMFVSGGVEGLLGFQGPLGKWLKNSFANSH